MVLDVASNRKMLQAILKRNGAKMVDLAENGQEAIEAALADPQKYGIVFMDNLMPVMVTLCICIYKDCVLWCLLSYCDMMSRVAWRRLAS